MTGRSSGSGAKASSRRWRVEVLIGSGRAFGGKHHTTVLHSINKIEHARHTDLELNRMLHSLMDSLQ